LPSKKTDATITTDKPTKDSPMAHSIELDRLNLQNAKLAAENAGLRKKVNEAKAAMKTIESTYDAEICGKLKLNIQNLLGYSDVEVAALTHGKTDKELSAMLANFSTAIKNVKREPGTFKSISAGAAEPRAYGDQSENLTVGNIYGKTRKEILEMGGKF